MNGLNHVRLPLLGDRIARNYGLVVFSLSNLKETPCSFHLWRRICKELRFVCQ